MDNPHVQRRPVVVRALEGGAPPETAPAVVLFLVIVVVIVIVRVVTAADASDQCHGLLVSMEVFIQN